jgi:outer membrane protein insertion porin family
MNTTIGRRFAPGLLLGTILGSTASSRARRRPTPHPRRKPHPSARASQQRPAGRPRARRGRPGDGPHHPIAHRQRRQRLEPDTGPLLRQAAAGEPYTIEQLDQAIKDLYATELFADVTIAGADTGDIVLRSGKSGHQPHRLRRQ